MEGLRLSNNYLSGDIPPSLSACVQLKTLDLSFNNLTGNIPSGFGNLSQLQLLYLRGNQLTGELPPAIFNISSLLIFNVLRNRISGSIPKEICSQPLKLESIILTENQFVGEIPSTLMRCHSLKYLQFKLNKFTGNLPIEICNLSAMQAISLAHNELTGTIPPSIGNLSNLEVLDISNNKFHGIVPEKIGELSSFTWLSIGLNELNGEVPKSIFNLTRLQLLSFGFNNLSGNLPFSIDKGLPNIQELYLSFNQFHGKIPDSVANLSQLKILELTFNSFTGHIPTSLGKLHQLQILNMAENQLTNNISKPEQDFLSSLTTCKYLKVISIESNPITGVLPRSLGSGNLSESLEKSLSRSCQIASPLPNLMGNLSKLYWLDLAYNDLTGAIPETLGRLRKLQNLDLQGNKLDGSISNVLCNLSNLFNLNLAENDLFGQLTGCLGNLSLLREINIAANAFDSSISAALWLIKQLEKLNFSNNFFDGSLSQEIGNLKSLIQLDLSGNQLSGEIPTAILQLQRIINMSLSNNKFRGPIFESFGDLKDLQRLELSHNSLYGPIPKSLESLERLSYFNVSFNELTGEIPNSGPFLNFTAEFFTGNKGLCGAPRFKVEACRNNMPTSSWKNKLLKYILPTIASVVVAALILILVLRRHGRKLLSFDLSLRLMHERISYREILGATSNLDEENLIGRGSFGSVYKGNFSSRMVAAVKVFNLDVQGALKSFDTECQILRSIRHRNLVKVITSCSNFDFKALVMAYMPNGNLEKWLYSGYCSVNILQRFEIMTDVASAIEYLHGGYTFPIAHCDLKPNNILLDEDMVAHVADFGIAKLLTEEQRMLHTRTLGTIGYMAPEYGSEGIVSTMVDVYSYGILLMEIISRRKPTDEMFTGELPMRQWMFNCIPNSIMQIVDDELLTANNERNESCLRSTIELALECTAVVPEERPNMKDVVARIKKIKLNLSDRNLPRASQE